MNHLEVEIISDPGNLIVIGLFMSLPVYLIYLIIDSDIVIGLIFEEIPLYKDILAYVHHNYNNYLKMFLEILFHYIQLNYFFLVILPLYKNYFIC